MLQKPQGRLKNTPSPIPNRVKRLLETEKLLQILYRISLLNFCLSKIYFRSNFSKSTLKASLSKFCFGEIIVLPVNLGGDKVWSRNFPVGKIEHFKNDIHFRWDI